MRSERNAVSSFTLDPQPACLIALLAHRSVDYRFDQHVVNFKGIGETVRNMRVRHPGQQHCAERLVAVANISIAEPVDKITATDAKRSGALQNEPSDRVSVLTEARLDVGEPMWPPSGFVPDGATLTARSGALVVVKAG